MAAVTPDAAPVLHAIYDPLCGWCYAAAPLLAVAREQGFWLGARAVASHRVAGGVVLGVVFLASLSLLPAPARVT